MGRLPPDEMMAPAGRITASYPVQEAGEVTVTVDVPIPVGITEIAEALGTTPGTIRSWRHRHSDFPESIAELAMGPLFDLREVRRWREARR